MARQNGLFHRSVNELLTGIAPKADSSLPGFPPDIFKYNPTTLYYLPGTTGWGDSFAGRPTALWTLPYPMIVNSSLSAGVQSNQLGFTISWATNRSVVVEACTNLSNPVWRPLQTNTLTAGMFRFTDPQWTNSPGRFYRIHSP